MKPCRVSVVVATKNRSALLAEAIRSIQALQGPDLELEILVVDNGSTDDTPEVVRGLGLELLHCAHTTPPGPAAVRNVGIRAAAVTSQGYSPFSLVTTTERGDS